MSKDKSFADSFDEGMRKQGFERVPVNEAQLERISETGPEKYPIISAPISAELIDHFNLQDSRKPSFFREKVTVSICGCYPECANGHLLVYETVKKSGLFFVGTPFYYSYLIGVFEPGTKKEDVIPQFQQRLEHRLDELCELDLKS